MINAIFQSSGILNRERRSKLLLVSIVLFFILPSFSETREIGRIFIVLNLYVTLVAATMELREKSAIFWSAIPIATVSMALLAVSHYYPSTTLLVANGIALTLFLGLVSISLFVHLGEPGQVTTSRIYACVSLYLMLGMCWFSIYNLLNILQPGSLVAGGVPLDANPPWSTVVYFSLTTLTTLGYGDIVPVTPPARTCATLEAAAGVLYIAITVARLVGGQQSRSSDKHP